ncbi:YpzG family protein [Neobacillus cucumis]|uniref:YpzG family protein n=1 Tax=Neobacillus cucumis TaxID=1740721 RepID=UPI001964988D|nr:YpzG family protein [Neobacillus cucumis]MDR4946892.1 YpzG family protein [Neobacillus cucumis]MED4229333.1 YpzG family protein [Neobacillus cucumis]
MSYRDTLDSQSELFHYTFTRPKHTKALVNGQTRVSQNQIILRSNAKAHRW